MRAYSNKTIKELVKLAKEGSSMRRTASTRPPEGYCLRSAAYTLSSMAAGSWLHLVGISKINRSNEANADNGAIELVINSMARYRPHVLDLLSPGLLRQGQASRIAAPLGSGRGTAAG